MKTEGLKTKRLKTEGLKVEEQSSIFNLQSSILVILISLAVFFFSGCYSAGKVTGKTVDKVEKWTEDFRKGYEDAKED